MVGAGGAGVGLTDRKATATPATMSRATTKLASIAQRPFARLGADRTAARPRFSEAAAAGPVPAAPGARYPAATQDALHGRSRGEATQLETRGNRALPLTHIQWSAARPG